MILTINVFDGEESAMGLTPATYTAATISTFTSLTFFIPERPSHTSHASEKPLQQKVTTAGLQLGFGVDSIN
jgi:hypothetical protein